MMSKNKYLLDFGERLKTLRQNKGLSQEELAFESELDRTYISMLERNIKSPTLTTILKITRALKISPSIFFEENIKTDKPDLKIKTPFYGTSVSCGIPVGGDYVINKELSLEDYLVAHPKKTFFIKASGDSMSPTILHGDLLIVEQTSKFKNEDIVLAQINNEFTVKKYIKSHDNIHLAPINPNYSEVSINDGDEVIFCGVIKGIARNF